jgi:hypothetical protein
MLVQSRDQLGTDEVCRIPRRNLILMFLQIRVACVWLQKLRSSGGAEKEVRNFLRDDEYDEIRNYIRYDIDPGFAIVSVIDNAAVTGYFNTIPFGAHLLYRRTHPRLQSLVMLVTPYNLVHYKIVLARTYQALAPEMVLTAVNPQTGESYTPRLVNPRGRILTLPQAVDANYAGAPEVIQRTATALLERLNSGMRVIIDQSHTRSLGTEN